MTEFKLVPPEEASVEILRIEADGKVYLRGKLVESDAERIEAYRIIVQEAAQRGGTRLPGKA